MVRGTMATNMISNNVLEQHRFLAKQGWNRGETAQYLHMTGQHLDDLITDVREGIVKHEEFQDQLRVLNGGPLDDYIARADDLDQFRESNAQRVIRATGKYVIATAGLVAVVGGIGMFTPTDALAENPQATINIQTLDEATLAPAPFIDYCYIINPNSINPAVFEGYTDDVGEAVIHWNLVTAVDDEPTFYIGIPYPNPAREKQTLTMFSDKAEGLDGLVADLINLDGGRVKQVRLGIGGGVMDLEDEHLSYEVRLLNIRDPETGAQISYKITGNQDRIVFGSAGTKEGLAKAEVPMMPTMADSAQITISAEEDGYETIIMQSMPIYEGIDSPGQARGPYCYRPAA